MRFYKRNSVFETNSSSVHSLTINAAGRQPNKIKMKDGYLMASFGSFTDHGIYTTQKEKLSYIVTCLWYLAGMPEELDDLYHYYLWEHVEDIVKEYFPGCKGIRIEKFKKRRKDYEDEPYIDHQSVPDYDSDMPINIWDPDSLIDFIWNDYVALKCWRD